MTAVRLAEGSPAFGTIFNSIKATIRRDEKFTPSLPMTAVRLAEGSPAFGTYLLLASGFWLLASGFWLLAGYYENERPFAPGLSF
jgi:hypothetical protein